MKTLILCLTIVALCVLSAFNIISVEAQQPYVYYWNTQWYWQPRPNITYFYNTDGHYYCPNEYPSEYVQYNCWPSSVDVCECPFPSKVSDGNNYCWTDLDGWSICPQTGEVVEQDIIPPLIDNPPPAPETIDSTDPGMNRDPTFAGLTADSNYPDANIRYYNWGVNSSTGVYWCPYNGGYRMTYCDFGGYCPCLDPPQFAMVNVDNYFTEAGPYIDLANFPFLWASGWFRQTFSNAIVYYVDTTGTNKYQLFTNSFCWNIQSKTPFENLEPTVAGGGSNMFDSRNSTVDLLFFVDSTSLYFNEAGLYVNFFDNAIVYYRANRIFNTHVPYVLNSACWNGNSWTINKTDTSVPIDSSTGIFGDSSTGVDTSSGSSVDTSSGSAVDTSSGPVVDSSTSSPLVDSSTNSPAVASSTSSPTIASSTSNPAVDSSTSSPAASSTGSSPVLVSSTGTADTSTGSLTNSASTHRICKIYFTILVLLLVTYITG